MVLNLLNLNTPPHISGGVSIWLFHIVLVKEDGFLSNFEDSAIADFIEGIIRHVRDILESSVKVIYFNIIVIVESTKPIITRRICHTDTHFSHLFQDGYKVVFDVSLLLVSQPESLTDSILLLDIPLLIYVPIGFVGETRSPCAVAVRW